ncbi:hypothetical protein BC567DRAFT_271669, partial [Phyllosticta citribraziliensis]
EENSTSQKGNHLLIVVEEGALSAQKALHILCLGDLGRFLQRLLGRPRHCLRLADLKCPPLRAILVELDRNDRRLEALLQQPVLDTSNRVLEEVPNVAAARTQRDLQRHVGEQAAREAPVVRVVGADLPNHGNAGSHAVHLVEKRLVQRLVEREDVEHLHRFVRLQAAFERVVVPEVEVEWRARRHAPAELPEHEAGGVQVERDNAEVEGLDVALRGKLREELPDPERKVHQHCLGNCFDGVCLTVRRCPVDSDVLTTVMGSL